jgi:hypothetical protein
MPTRDRSTAPLRVVTEGGEVREITEAELDALVDARSRELRERAGSAGTLGPTDLGALVEDRARARLEREGREGASASLGPFDRVVLTTDEGEVRDLTRAQFDKLQLDQRVRAILRKQLRFYRLGVEIPMREALKSH